MGSYGFASSAGEGKFSKEEVGLWATGRPILNPTAGLVGVRPVVDRYSVTRYSPGEWKKKNQDVLEQSIDINQLKKSVKYTMNSVTEGTDKQQADNTARIVERTKEVRDCKNEMEALIKDFRKEIVLLTETKIKLKYSLPALKMPESIAGECIDRRTTRIEPDLVKDEVEVELVKELSMIKDARDLYVDIINQIEKQILQNKACKDQLELSWSDKKETCELDSINGCLKNSSVIITYYGGAARFPGTQSSPESWAVFNATLINMAKDELSKSRDLRKTAEENVIQKSVMSLRKQADIVYNALLRRIEETDQTRQMFENELQIVLKQIAEAESLYGGLIELQRQLDLKTKVVETRLNNRLKRPRIENCKDSPAEGLIEEVHYLNDSKSRLKKQIEEIDKTVTKLYENRSNIESAILTKRKSLYVDQQRCMAYRDRYPDAVSLAGGNS